VTETYTSGAWIVKLSFAPWESFEAQNAWKESPEFRERIMRVRAHCEDFRPSTLELVTVVE
jgi:heme-degrading monooxygenase HmoA